MKQYQEPNIKFESFGQDVIMSSTYGTDNGQEWSFDIGGTQE